MPLKSRFFLPFATLALTAQTRAADTAAGETLLAPVVVTASLFEEPLADAPNTVNIVGEEEIREAFSSRTLPWSGIAGPITTPISTT